MLCMQNYNSSFFNNVNVTVTDGGYFNLKPDGEWKQKPHVYQQNKFYFIVDGSCNIMINGTSYVAKKGDWFFIPSGTLHAYQNISGVPMKKYWMHFDISPKLEFEKNVNFPCKISVENKNITALTREIVVALIDRIEIFEDNSIVITFNYMDEINQMKELLSMEHMVPFHSISP